MKVSIEGLGANKSEKAIGRVAKALGVLSKTTESFDSKLGLKAPGGKHSDADEKKDLAKIVSQLLENDIFNPAITTTHRSFIHLKKNLIKTLDETQLKDWMIERFAILVQPEISPSINIDSDDDI